jgi:hypothetical protein
LFGVKKQQERRLKSTSGREALGSIYTRFQDQQFKETAIAT